MTLATFLKWVNLPFREIVPLGIQPSNRWNWETNANGRSCPMQKCDSYPKLCDSIGRLGNPIQKVAGAIENETQFVAPLVRSCYVVFLDPKLHIQGDEPSSRPIIAGASHSRFSLPQSSFGQQTEPGDNRLVDSSVRMCYEMNLVGLSIHEMIYRSAHQIIRKTCTDR